MVVTEKKKISKEEWGKFVAENSSLSYSLIVCICIMDIWEAGCKTEDECHKELRRNSYGISGTQAEIAISFALSNDAEEWLDSDMKAICRNEEITVTERVVKSL